MEWHGIVGYNLDMAKINLNVAGLDLEIEAEPEECAAILLSLAGAETAGSSLKTSRMAVAPGSNLAVGSNPRVRGRTYGGRANRRQLVLDTLEILALEGNVTPSLDEIKRCFSSHYPNERLRHLDQVVRDLANKTGLVERREWGKFQLVEKGSGE